MQPNCFDWIEDVLADIQRFCDENGLIRTSDELARVRIAYLAEGMSRNEAVPANCVTIIGDGQKN